MTLHMVLHEDGFARADSQAAHVDHLEIYIEDVKRKPQRGVEVMYVGVCTWSSL